MASIFGNYQARNDINTWISAIYCEKWGLKEGLRELIQNQRDELINILGKENIETQALNDYEFNFLKKGENEVYGSITYDSIRQILSLENKGKLETFNLLLGGTTRNPQNNSAITGQFGEGLKIAAIALLRQNKSLSIINTDQVWRFTLKNDNNFKRNGQPEKCLFWRWDEYSNPINEGKVIVQIRNITIDEWKDIIDNYLWLATKVKRLGIINAGSYGDIILNPEFKDRIYSRGVFVTKSSGVGFGYNLDLPLDRDRNCITNYSDFSSKANRIINHLLENYNQYRINFGNFENFDFTEIEMFDNFPEQILNLLNSNSNILNSYCISRGSANFIWELNAQKQRTSDIRFNFSDMKKVPQPLCDNNISSLQSFLRSKLLPDTFYDYFIASNKLYSALTKSNYYESYYDRFNRQFQAKQIITPPVPTPQINIENNLSSVISKIHLVNSSFNRNQIVFKNFDSDEQYYSADQKYYFSSVLFQNPQKLEEFVFRKCLCMLGISIDNILQRFRLIPR